MPYNPDYDLKEGVALVAMGKTGLILWEDCFILGDMERAIPYTMATKHQLGQIWAANWPNRPLKYRILGKIQSVDFLGMFKRRYNMSIDWHESHKKKR